MLLVKTKEGSKTEKVYLSLVVDAVLVAFGFGLEGTFCGVASMLYAYDLLFRKK